MSSSELNVTDHSRNSAGLRYVYPVISRRAGGVSVGINLNTNNACNWRCIYCQVPHLKPGTAPTVDMMLLEQELRGFLQELLQGDFMRQHVPEEMRRIKDIALSGNGEPTSAQEFAQIVALIGKLKNELNLSDDIKLVLITNGSLLYRVNVQSGLRLMAGMNGEVWFKLDRASEAGMLLVNDTQATLAKVRENLSTAISLCPTWLQTCWFALDGKAPSKQDENDYLTFLGSLLNDCIAFQGVLLYGLARPSLRAEAYRLSALPAEHLESFAARIREMGVCVKVSI